MESGEETIEMVLGTKPGMTALATRVSGRKTRLVAEDNSNTSMETSTLATGKTTRQMDTVLTSTSMEPNTKANGRMTYSMG